MRRLVPVLLFASVACNSQPAPAPAAKPPAAAASAMITATSTSPEAVVHFRKGEELFDNGHVTDATAEFEQALKLDPKFMLARAYHGFANATPAGLQELDAAARDAAGVPEAERVFIEGLAQVRRGDFSKSEAAFRNLVTIAPSDWRAHFWLGNTLAFEQKLAEAVAPLKKATSLNPDAGVAQNALGYAALQQGDAAGAIAAFQEYVRIMPQEANAQDSLGEALLTAGRFADAEAAFQKAVTLSPQFWNGWQGIGYAKLYAGDLAGGRAALEKAKATAALPADKMSLDSLLATVALTQRDTETALGIYDAAGKTDGAASPDIAYNSLARASALSDAGRDREALGPIAAVIAQADAHGLPPVLARALKGAALNTRIVAEYGLHDVAAAEQTAKAIDELAAVDADNPYAQSGRHFGAGMLALTKGQPAAARAEFDRCLSQDVMCRWQGLKAADKAGDKPGADAARTALLKNYLRNPQHLLMRSRVAPASSEKKSQ